MFGLRLPEVLPAKAHGAALERQRSIKSCFWHTWNLRGSIRYVMVGPSFIILSETPCADPHAGCCGGRGLETLGYPISTYDDKARSTTPGSLATTFKRTNAGPCGFLSPLSQWRRVL